MEIGFSELLLCMLVAFVVLGPKELLKVTRVLGKTVGTFKLHLREMQKKAEQYFDND